MDDSGFISEANGTRSLPAWAAAFRQAGSRALRGALALIYPPSCIACRAALAEAHALCPACWQGLSFIERPYCERLGLPFAYDIGGTLLSPAAIADPPVFDRARAVCRYDGTARALVQRLKYGDRLDLARTMARMMAQAGREILEGADLLVPVPLHQRRLWSRRFNQAAALASHMSAQTGRAWEPLALRRRKNTRPQVGLSRAERAANLQGALHVPEEARLHIEGRRIVLIDDVLTTGSTANAAARALLRAGATHVDVLAFARVVPEGM